MSLAASSPSTAGGSVAKATTSGTSRRTRSSGRTPGGVTPISFTGLWAAISKPSTPRTAGPDGGPRSRDCRAIRPSTSTRRSRPTKLRSRGAIGARCRSQSFSDSTSARSRVRLAHRRADHEGIALHGSDGDGEAGGRQGGARREGKIDGALAAWIQRGAAAVVPDAVERARRVCIIQVDGQLSRRHVSLVFHLDRLRQTRAGGGGDEVRPEPCEGLALRRETRDRATGLLLIGEPEVAV